MAILRVLLLTYITVLISCSNSSFQEDIESYKPMYIWGGSIVDSPKDQIYRNTVFIASKYLDENKKTKFSTCTGVVLSPRHILTAAHCIKKQSPTASNISQTVIQLIDINKAKATDYIKVIDYKVNEYYASGNFGDDRYDVAVLLLQKPLLKAVPAKFSEDSALASLSKDIFISGYGDYDEGKFDFRLRTTKVVLSDGPKAKDILFEPLVGCTMHGDSGGPAYYLENGKPVIFGIASAIFGYSNGLGPCQKYMQYSLVKEYRDFIDKAVQKLK